jgi:hypothetical protein
MDRIRPIVRICCKCQMFINDLSYLKRTDRDGNEVYYCVTCYCNEHYPGAIKLGDSMIVKQ